MTTEGKNVGALVGWIALSLLAGLFGGIASANDATFYAQLDRPAWAPPSWLFAPVWTTLYTLMGIAAWLVWRERARDRQLASVALALFVAQLVLNALWTPVFFGLFPFLGVAALWIAAVIILALDVLVLLTMLAFWRVRRLSAVLLIPYWAWLLYATTLNIGDAVLND